MQFLYLYQRLSNWGMHTSSGTQQRVWEPLEYTDQYYLSCMHVCVLFLSIPNWIFVGSNHIGQNYTVQSLKVVRASVFLNVDGTPAEHSIVTLEVVIIAHSIKGKSNSSRLKSYNILRNFSFIWSPGYTRLRVTHVSISFIFIVVLICVCYFTLWPHASLV